MATSNESQCYPIRLQIDGFLDDELKPLQREAFISHIQGCAACSRELQFAQTLHDRLLDMPQPDCDERVLKPVYRLCENISENPSAEDAAPLRLRFSAWLAAAPLSLRMAAPAALAVLVLAVGVTIGVTLLPSNPLSPWSAPVPVAGTATEPAFTPSPVSTPVPVPAPAPNQPWANDGRPMTFTQWLVSNGARPYNGQYTDEEIRQALQDLHTAIEYLNQAVSERTDTIVGSRYLMPPLQDTFNASLRRISDDEANRPLQDDGPI